MLIHQNIQGEVTAFDIQYVSSLIRGICHSKRQLIMTTTAITSKYYFYKYNYGNENVPNIIFLS